MPPRTRSVKSSKNLKENNNVVVKAKQKPIAKVTKSVRKVLADKTNSTSDDNVSVEPKAFPLVKQSTVLSKTKKVQKENENPLRPRRDRRLPSRFVENEVLKNLSNSKDDTSTPEKVTQTPTNKSNTSPFKIPDKIDIGIVATKPRRVCRLPSKFSDHSLSPKHFPIQPFSASTPIAQKKLTVAGKCHSGNQEKKKSTSNVDISAKRTSPRKNLGDKKSVKIPVHTNSNEGKRLRARKLVATKELTKEKLIKLDSTPAKPSQKSRPNKTTKCLTKQVKNQTKTIYTPEKQAKSPGKQIPGAKPSSSKQNNMRKVATNLSFKVLENKKKDVSKDDVYEFTFDPNEEPTPKKKKRRVAKKKPSKPKTKTVVFKNNYDQNVSKALTALKDIVAKKQVPKNKVEPVTNVTLQEAKKTISDTKEEKSVNEPQTIPQIQRNVASKIIIGGAQQNDSQKSATNTQNNNHESSGPPNIVITENISVHSNKSDNNLSKQNKSIPIEDIAADFEFSPQYDGINYSPVNTPDRPKTPLPQNLAPHSTVNHNDPLNLRENNSFFDEHPVASSSMIASTRLPEASPWRVEFESLPIRWHVNSYVKPNMTPAVECSFINFEDKNKKKHVYTNMVLEADDVSPESTKGQKRKNDDDEEAGPVKTPRKEKDTLFFGFDDSENQNSENVSPVKNTKTRKRAAKPRDRAVLKEMNKLTGPTRVVIPVAVKTARNADIEKMFREMKSAADAPVFPEKEQPNVATANVNEAFEDELNEDSQSVHLFEDIELVHHLKPHRKSYEKRKKVTFRQASTDSDTQNSNPRDDAEDSEEEQHLNDLTFDPAVPFFEEKKCKKKKNYKQKMTKKEEQEAEKWAANFNSMCEDVEDFPLVVE